MTLGLKIKCSCYCSYTISNTLSLDKISCPNCGKIPSFSDKVVDLMKTASQISDSEKDNNGDEIFICFEDMNIW